MSTGYLDRNPRHARSLAIAIAAHAGVLALILTFKPTVLQHPFDPPIVIETIPLPPIAHPKPDPKPQPRPSDQRPDPHPQPPPVPVDTSPPISDPNAVDSFPPPQPTQPPADPGVGTAEPPAQPPVQPVLVGPAIDARYARDLQPPYPPAMERMEQEGSVTVRIQIGRDGRVLDVLLVRTDADDFFTATKAWALRKWRFRPATSDGEPVVGWLTKTVVFKIAR